MAKAFDRYRERQRALAAFGKDLVRRAGSCCELCEMSGVKLAIFEVPPATVEPELDHCILVCETCEGQLLQASPRLDARHWRCLKMTVWSDVPAVQVTAVRLLRALADEDWAQTLLDALYLDPEVEAWAETRD